MKLTHIQKKWLSTNFHHHLRFDEPLSKHTSFHVGGPAEVFVMPSNYKDIRNLLTWSHKESLPIFILGGGTNLLIKEKGIQGIVISLKKYSQFIEKTALDCNSILLKVSAATKTAALCQYAIKHGYKGLNFAIGIPGTIGGAVHMNAEILIHKAVAGVGDAHLDRIIIGLILCRCPSDVAGGGLNGHARRGHRQAISQGLFLWILGRHAVAIGLAGGGLDWGRGGDCGFQIGWRLNSHGFARLALVAHFIGCLAWDYVQG